MNDMTLLTNIITQGIVLFAIYGILRYLKLFSHVNPVFNKEGKIILKYPSVYATIGYLGIGLFSLVEIIFIITNETNFRTDIAADLIFLVFILLALILIFMTHVTVEVDKNKIEKNNIIGHKITINWADVKKIKFTKMTNLIIISNESRIKINIMIQGFDDLINMIKQETPFSVHEDAIKQIEKARKQGF